MIGQTISHYEILEKLGEGGMGVVYKAQDKKLNRPVALKFLPTHVSASDQDRSRFVQEAQAAAALNHPNICTIHGIEEQDGPQGEKQVFIVMEYVDGQTLQEKKHALSQKQAIDIAIQIADGLAAAHEKGIVHRDIKPENIMVRKDGLVQIMDFGLAKLRGASRLTKEGSTVGTIGYMSPEQVQGLEVDHRTDIFSLGVLMYEILCGQLPFRGVHETAIIYEIVNVDAPPLSSARQDIDPELDRIVLECLDKDRDERCQSAKEISKDLKRFKRESGRQRVSRVSPVQNVSRMSMSSASFTPPSSGMIRTPESGAMAVQPEVSGIWNAASRMSLPWIIASLSLIVALAAGGFLLFRGGATDRIVAKAAILSPLKVNYNTDVGGHVALSPDGKTLAFVGVDTTGQTLLWVRPLNSLLPIALTGTNGAEYPFWSPDSRTIAFFASGQLRKIDATGGPCLTICSAPQGRGGTWNKDGVIVFAPSSADGLYRVSAAGGSPVRVTRIDSTQHQVNHRWPFFLPDGKHFLYTDMTTPTGSTDNDQIYVGALDSSINRPILHAGSNMAYANGNLLFIRQENLMAQPFDPSSFTLTGDAVPIAQQIHFANVRSRGIFSVSDNGVLVFQNSGGTQATRFMWIDRNGKTSSEFGDRPIELASFLSPDGKRIAFDSYDLQSRNIDLWIYDLAKGLSTRLTFDPMTDRNAVWSPDGNTIVFSSNRKGHYDIYQKKADGTGTEEPLLVSDIEKGSTDWSRDGRYVLLSVNGKPGTKWDLWILPMFGDKKPFPFLETEYSEWAGAFSPDTRWIAYQSDESGRYEIYVRPFQGTEGKWQVSTAGGLGPYWREDGKELYYESADRKFMAVDIKTTGSTFQAGTPHALFDMDTKGQGSSQGVTQNGQRFLITIAPGASSLFMTVVMNWDAELKKK
jgi:eukaryotic-like serine/threonine-protein kinase